MNSTPSQEQDSVQRATRIVEMAYEQHNKEGEVEVSLEHDPVNMLSEGDDNGCYVRAWVWVDFEGTEFDKEPATVSP